MKELVILGAGQAGLQCAASLRQLGFDGAIRIVGDEPGLPYQRPPLSKAFLLGKQSANELILRPQSFLDSNEIHLIHDRVREIDNSTKRITLASRLKLDYDHLVIATGARNRALQLPGAELEGVYGLRTLADAEAIGKRLHQVEDVVVIGAGFIGLEFAAVAEALGKRVNVVEVSSRAMARAVSSKVSSFFADSHREWKAALHLGSTVSRILGKRAVAAVELQDGKTLPAGLVLYGIGVDPNSEIASEAGLKCANGIVVDHLLRTNDVNISSIGDCASFPCPWANTPRIRLESVQNATDQARALATILVGNPSEYRAIPWFWSDQGDLKLQIVGLADGHDRIVQLGNPSHRSFTNLLYRGDRLIASESVNRPGDYMSVRKLLSSNMQAVLPLDVAQSEEFDIRAWTKKFLSAG